MRNAHRRISRVMPHVTGVPYGTVTQKHPGQCQTNLWGVLSDLPFMPRPEFSIREEIASCCVMAWPACTVLECAHTKDRAPASDEGTHIHRRCVSWG